MAIATTLTKGSKRSIGRAMIPRFLKLGYNRQQGLDYLKSKGIGYRRTTYLSDWSLLSGIEQRQDPLKYVRSDLKPSKALITKTNDIQELRYKYIYGVLLYDPTTGQSVETSTTLQSNYLHPMGEIDDMVEPRIGMNDSKPGAVLQSFYRQAIIESSNPKFGLDGGLKK